MSKSIGLKVNSPGIGKEFKLMRRMYGYYLLLIPVIAYFVIFWYIPMYGVTLAFKNFRIADGILGSPWVGLQYFKQLFGSFSFFEVLRNTVLISIYRIIFGFPVPIILALLLNEIYHIKFKKIAQYHP